MASPVEAFMDRKEFLKGCVTGVCACAAACLPKTAFAADTQKDDWRLPFVKQRYAKLIKVLGQRMDDKALSASLQELGEFCAAQDDEKMAKFRGDPDGYCMEIEKHGTAVTRDKANNVYTTSFDPKGSCGCPLNGEKTPGAVCECSIGWTRHTWTTVLGKAPKVVLKESVLRGGKVCKVEVTAA
jgi:hypothetical protein